MKSLSTLFLVLCFFTTQAQIVSFNNAARNTFYGIGGYSYTQNTLTNGVQTNPFVLMGPSPQNDFSYAASAIGGITNRADYISTTNTNTAISIQFFGNNIRKFGCRVVAYNAAVTNTTNDIISLTATTNLGNSISQTGNQSGRFVGFNVTGNENEYIVSITATFQNPPSPAAFLTIDDITVGDNSPQNVALNFDGVDDYVSIPSNIGNNTGNFNSFTVTCWIKPDATQPSSTTDPSENDILSKWAGLNAGINNNYPFVIRYLNTTRSNVNERGKILVGIWDGTNFPTIISNTAVNDGKWHHVAFVKTNTTNTLTLYIDGVLNGSTTNTISNTTLNTTPLQIGRRGNGQNYFRGDIDEVRIWSTNKDQATIQAEMFCKHPTNTTGLRANYNFSNGVPHDNNTLITQVQDASLDANHGTLTNFTKTGDASNFVTGQVKYVSGGFTGGDNGSSWANGFDLLQSALTANTCNDLFDVYVAKGFSDYKPSFTGDNTASFNIPSGMRLYGGFAGTEKSINHRNRALIHSTYKTTLSGDLFGDDTSFDFSNNRFDNSITVVNIQASPSNTFFDGFTVKGASQNGLKVQNATTSISNSKFIDNGKGLNGLSSYMTVSNCSMMGNLEIGIEINGSLADIKESLVANNNPNGNGTGILISNPTNTNLQTTIINSTIVSNRYGIFISTGSGAISNNLIKNTIIHGNNLSGITTVSPAGTTTNTITYSLVQGNTGGSNGNLNGNTTNPQFVNPLANSVISDAGDYRLKDSSPCINTGDDAGVSPLDLDRNPRPRGGKTDMGAYESNINQNEIISKATGNWETTTTWNLERLPLATDKVILNGHQVTVTTNTARAKDLEYKTGAVLRYLSGGLLRFGL
jgi:Concanavalin A-like lectin/glucanases superfamily